MTMTLNDDNNFGSQQKIKRQKFYIEIIMQKKN